MTTLQAFSGAPADDFTGGAAIFANDFQSAVAGIITGLWYYHTGSNEGANAGVQVHRVTGATLLGSKAFSTALLTDNAWNLIALDTPVVYATPDEAVCIGAWYPTGMGFSYVDGLSNTTVGDLTCIRSTARFKNAGVSFGDFPTGNDTTVGFGVGIEFVAGASHAKGAEFLSFF